MIYDQWENRPSSYYPYADRLVGGWDPNTTRDVTVYISPHNVTTLIKPRDFCDTPMHLLIMVCSAPGNFDARQAIRETWGMDYDVSGFMIYVYFLMGQTQNTTLQQMINEEAEKYNDIVQERFYDSYNNLTLKSLMMLKIVETSCMNSVRFLMKTDDDMYVHLDPLVKTLNKINSSLLIGALHCRVRPIRDSNNKWYAPKYMYVDKVYPPYLSGTGYVMSIDVVRKLFEASFKVPVFHLEDVYITGLVSRVIRLKPRGDPGFSFSTRKVDACAFKNAYTSHRVNASDMRRLYDLLQSTNLDHCKVQSEPKEADSAISRFISLFSVNKPNKLKKSTCY